MIPLELYLQYTVIGSYSRPHDPSSVLRLCEDGDARVNLAGVVEADVLVQARDVLDLILRQVEAIGSQVLSQTLSVVTLGNNGDTTLGGPSEKNLGGGYGSYGELPSTSGLKQRYSLLLCVLATDATTSCSRRS